MKTEVDFDDVLNDFIEDARRTSYSSVRTNDTFSDVVKKLMTAMTNFDAQQETIKVLILDLPQQNIDRLRDELGWQDAE